MVECQTRDVFGFVARLEDTHPLVQHVGLVQGPEGDVVFAARHYLVGVQRVELCRYHCVH